MVERHFDYVLGVHPPAMFVSPGLVGAPLSTRFPPEYSILCGFQKGS